jgi:putative transposase
MASFIDEHQGEHGVEPICTALQVAPSTYYAAKKRQPFARALRDAFEERPDRALEHEPQGLRAPPKHSKAAQRAGHDVGRDQVGSSHA